MLTAESLSKRFGGERTLDAVSELNFELEKGRFIAIVGRSGSGKSTLLGMLGGISRPTAGNVLVDGTNQWLLSDDDHSDFRNRKIGFVFQFASLLPTLRAIDNVALPALVGGVEDRKAYARATAFLNRVGLRERADYYPSQLSGGEQRRVAIARALINSPDILLADEPTADLDEETEEEILNLLVDIHRAFNLTLVVVTHNPVIADRADQVLTMRGGRAVVNRVGQGPKRSLYQRQATAEAAEQIKQIFEATTDASDRVRLGEGIERLIGRFIMWIIPMILIACGINAAVTDYEQRQIDARVERRLALEDLAMKGLRAEVKQVTFGTDHTYNVDVYLRNTTSGQTLYVMSPTVRAFVQVGSSWQEVPLKPADPSSKNVLKVEGTKVLRYILEPDVHGYAELLPYYMHVRISNDMIVSPSNQPKDDLIERSDNYYVYLKPHDADDTAILRKLKFPGTPPVWIPMPPH
jgi:putative ABC transport system ATP-binding protein/macrolide transport system ATP-binding/permease protein/lipoprotein-releasing system ATP-binding protein